MRRFDRPIPDEEELPIPDIRGFLRIEKRKQTAARSPSTDNSNYSEEATPDQPPETGQQTPNTTTNNTTTSRRGRVQDSMVLPENIPGHEASTLMCNSGTMWIDTARGGPNVKKLRLDSTNQETLQDRALRQQQKEDREQPRREAKQTANEKRGKRVRGDSQVIQGTSTREATQRATAAKEQVNNQHGKKGIVEQLCVTSATVRKPVLITSSQSLPNEPSSSTNDNCSGSGSKSGPGAKRSKKQTKQGSTLPECFTPTSSRVHAELENRLSQIWHWQLPEFLMTPHIFGSSLEILDSLLEVCGILRESEQQQWVSQLGQHRQKVVRTTWEVVSPETKPTQLIEEAVRDEGNLLPRR